MKREKKPSGRLRRELILLLASLLLLSGCGGGETEPVSPGPPSEEIPAPEAQDLAASPAAEAKGSRPNDSVVYLPEVLGETTLGFEPLLVDVSNASQGYVMVRYSGSAARANIQLTGPDGVNYKYFLPPSDDFSALPLTAGSGVYSVDAYENIEGNRYSVLYKETLQVELENELTPFLYANLYVDFNEQSEAVAKAREVVAPASNDLEAVGLVYHFVVENVVYDTQKAETVTSGYLPVVDETLRTGKGICFDYAALTAAMLRSQNIPTKLEIGYAGAIYHAWISVYTEETGWIDRVIEFSGDAWTRMDPTFASGNGNSDAILKYIGDGTNYALQYSH